MLSTAEELAELNSRLRKYWTILDVSLGGQLLGSLIVRTVNNSLPHTSANETRFLPRESELIEADDWLLEDVASETVAVDQWKLLLADRGEAFSLIQSLFCLF